MKVWLMSKYLRVKCKCGSEQNVFSHAASIVKCKACKEPIAYPAGGEAVIQGEIVKELG
jgi:ribosomal protein S27E